MKTTKATLMTEFGAVGNDPASIRLLNKVLTAAEALQQSWFYWTYRSYGDITTQNSDTETFFFPNGSIQSNKIKALSGFTSLIIVFPWRTWKSTTASIPDLFPIWTPYSTKVTN